MKQTILQFHTADPLRFLFTPISDPGAEWVMDFVAFFAWIPQDPWDPGRHRIYQYSANEPRRYMFSADPSIQSGWLKGGPAFYSFVDPQPGTVPIYQYHEEKEWGWNFRLSSDPIISEGWVRDSIAFYAFPNRIQLTSASTDARASAGSPSASG